MAMENHWIFPFKPLFTTNFRGWSIAVFDYWRIYPIIYIYHPLKYSKIYYYYHYYIYICVCVCVSVYIYAFPRKKQNYKTPYLPEARCAGPPGRSHSPPGQRWDRGTVLFRGERSQRVMEIMGGPTWSWLSSWDMVGYVWYLVGGLEHLDYFFPSYWDESSQLTNFFQDG
jgi:hypothetical protein